MKTAAVAFVLILGASAILVAQTKKSVKISTVAASGTVSESRYTNSFFNLTIDAPGATLKLSPIVNAAGQRARLLQAVVKAPTWDDTYTFAVLAESLAKHPDLQSSAQYLQSVRQELEKEGHATVREEFPLTIAGVSFTGVILREQVPSGKDHYRGLYATFRDGYILSFDAEASSEAKLNELVGRVVKFVN